LNAASARIIPDDPLGFIRRCIRDRSILMPKNGRLISKGDENDEMSYLRGEP
jgi:hypothetical protein